MDYLEETFFVEMTAKGKHNQSQVPRWFRMASVAYHLLTAMSNEWVFELMFTDCAPVYFVGYAMLALSDPGSRQEYAIKAIRFADVVAGRQGAWCDAAVLAAFRQRWPHADASAQWAVELAACGARRFPASWAAYLRSVCAGVGEARLPDLGFFSPQHPFPWTAWHLCEANYLELPALEPTVSLLDFHAMLAPRLDMVATPFWSHEVRASCAPEWNCSSQSHYMLAEAMRHVDYSIGGLWLEFGVFRGASANLTARFVRAKAMDACDGSQAGREGCRAGAPAVYAFDSFRGLPQAWYEHGTEDFDCQGVVPALEPNVRPVVGWFNASLPRLVAELQGAAGALRGAWLGAAFVHLDCDLYGSTLEALMALQRAKVLRRGTVLAFDELVHHASAAAEGPAGGELAALHRLLTEHPRPIEVIAGAWRRSTSYVGGFGAVRLLA